MESFQNKLGEYLIWKLVLSMTLVLWD
jgi:hypothetical protein